MDDEWTEPGIWQWTDDFKGLDANITPLTIEQLAGAGEQAGSGWQNPSWTTKQAHP